MRERKKKPCNAAVCVAQLSVSLIFFWVFLFFNSLHPPNITTFVQLALLFSCFPLFPRLCDIVIPLPPAAATGFITKCLSMCTFRTMLDRVARGHKLFVLQSDWSDTHILIPASESQPLKAARPSELLDKNSSIKRGLNLYRPSMKFCLSQPSCCAAGSEELMSLYIVYCFFMLPFIADGVQSALLIKLSKHLKSKNYL